MKHTIKIEQPYFQAVLDGDKTFEIRKNDRGYQKGDVVILEEWVEHIRGCPCKSGKGTRVVITYVTNYEQKDGFVVFGFKVIDQPSN